MNLAQVRLLAQHLSQVVAAADEAGADESTPVDLTRGLQQLDDAARDELAAAIKAAE